MTKMRYTYLGDAHTREELRGMQCDPVMIDPDGEVFADSDTSKGKCVVSTRMASALVEDANGKQYVVARRRLRLNSKLGNGG